ncbi:MAG TPA: transketolase [Fimbriimonadaceae bacterium]|nr:transketolase [Fimbriimonadaceae bacterium]
MAPVVPHLEEACIAVVRGLAVDAVQRAKSGHPGLPLGAAAIAHALWTRHLRFDPSDPGWPDRDRFILSAGHGSMLLYALLFLTGYDLPLAELQNFRQWGSRTPGHPENHLTPGVEMATGPLGQGVATSVGMALAERFLRATRARPGYEDLFGHWTYVLCSDGDLMEGVAQEAASLAGHQRLGRLVWLYDDNRITIDGGTDLTFSDDTPRRFEALGWHVQSVDGLDPDAVDRAIAAAKAAGERPSLIACRTVIGYGSPNKAGSSKAHGAPLGPEETLLTKRALGLPEEPFFVPDDVRDFYRRVGERGTEAHRAWSERYDAYTQAYPSAAGDWKGALPTFAESVATRKASQAVIDAVAALFPTLVGGSADLAESVFTEIHGGGSMQAGSPEGRNIAFGVREHAMAAACNGITLHGGMRAFGGTFLIFSDYCRPALRLAALMQCPTIFLFSHDSIGLGEDGPTHQPIEQLMSLRAIPNFNLMRPADGNETAACWALALESAATPCAIVLTRQSVPAVSPADVVEHPARRGAYVLRGEGTPAVVLVATGSEVGLAIEGARLLADEGIAARVVSMPSWFLFERQSEAYRQSVLPPGTPTLAIEAGATLGWERWADAALGIDRFGASAPGEVLFEKFGFTPANVAARARDLLAGTSGAARE